MLERVCLLSGLDRRPITEELGDQKNRNYERVEEQEVMPAPEEEQQVEAVASEAGPDYGGPYSPRCPLAAPDACNDEQRDTTENKEQGIKGEHAVYPAIDVCNLAASAVKVADVYRE